jgi:hypothetical protein
MADLITKIGADSSEFRNDVGSLPAVVKSNFEKMRTASEGGLVDNVEKLKGNFRQLKDVILGGGTVLAVVKFFQAGIEEAEKMAESGNKVAQAFLSIRDNGTGSMNAIGKASVLTFGSLALAANTFKEGLQNIGALMTGNLDALERSRDAVVSTGKAAREQEAALADMKKHADQWAKINSENLAATQKRAELELAALSTAEQKNVLEQKLMEAQRAEADASEHSLAARTAHVEQIKIGNQLLEVQKAINEETDKALAIRRQETELLNKKQLDGLEIHKQIAVYSQEIADSEALLAGSALNAKQQEAERVTIAERRKNLAEAQNKLTDQDRKFYEDIVKLGNDWAEFNAEVLTSQTKLNILKREEKEIRDALAKTDDETPERIKQENLLLDNQKKIRGAISNLAKDDSELAGILLKDEKDRTEQEKLRLSVLEGITTQAQLDAEKHDLVGKLVAGTIIPAERERLAILTGQTAEIKKQTAEALSYIDQWNKFTVSVTRTGTGYGQQSTTALEGLRDRLNAQLSTVGAGGRTYRDADQMTDYGGYLTGSTYKAELAGVESELAKRAQVTAYARQYGQDATVRQFGDDMANRALSDISSVSNQTKDLLSQINQRLASSGLFPAT